MDSSVATANRTVSGNQPSRDVEAVVWVCFQEETLSFQCCQEWPFCWVYWMHFLHLPTNETFITAETFSYKM